jgi:shikimate dehydrogenase
MYNVMFEYLGVEAYYDFLEVSHDDLNCFMKRVKTGEYAGISVTVPYKEVVLEYCDELSEEALKIGAVNCMYIKNGKVCGHNTDWYGFWTALCEAKISYNPEKVLVLGAGGAARGVLYALNQHGIVPFVANRTIENAEKLQQDFKCNPLDLEAVNSLSFDLIINTTSVGLKSDDKSLVSESLVAKSKIVFDLIYVETELVRLAKRNGKEIIDGKRMLLFQAEKQFIYFTGKNPDLKLMWESLN